MNPASSCFCVQKEKEVLREEIDHLKRRAAEKQQETERTHAALQASEARCLLETAEAQQLRGLCRMLAVGNFCSVIIVLASRYLLLSLPQSLLPSYF